MRKRKYLSPSQLSTYEGNSFFATGECDEAYYIKYLSDNRQPNEPQTMAMAIGGAFDCFAKAQLAKDLGMEIELEKDGDGKKISHFETLFFNAVDEHNRDEVFAYAHYCFSEYKKCGAYADLLSLMVESISDVEFEIRKSGVIKGEIHEIPVLGIPDASWVLPCGSNFIHDWKVNGYVSKSATSPSQGFVKCGNKIHKKAEPTRIVKGIVCSAIPLEHTSPGWADQMATYALLLGHTSGDIICGLDQLVFKPNGTAFPDMRVAQFRNVIEESYWRSLIVRYEKLWSLVEGDHYFENLSREESDAKCKHLNVVVGEDFLRATR